MDNPHRETLPQFHERAEQAVPPVRSGEVLADLIARLENATRPDRDLDFDIAMLLNAPFGAWESFQKYNEAFPTYTKRDVAAYTDSIDAALTLRPKGVTYTICDYQRPPEVLALLHRKAANVAETEQYSGKHSVAAIALCIAAFRARAATAMTAPPEEQSPLSREPISKATGAAS